MVGHSGKFSMWKTGEPASKGVEEVAEVSKLSTGKTERRRMQNYEFDVDSIDARHILVHAMIIFAFLTNKTLKIFIDFLDRKYWYYHGGVRNQ